MATGTGGAIGAPSEAGGEPATTTFAALAVRAYRDLFVVGVVVFVAVQAQQIARGQLAYELTGTNTGLGGVYLGFGIPMLVLTPLGGVAADRLPKRTVMIAAQSCMVVSAVWIGVADSFDFLEYWMLVGAAMIQAAGFSVFGPTRVAFTGEVVPRRLLPNAVVLTQMGLNSSRVFAPAVAGALIGISAIGTSGVYLITAGLMVVALVGTYRLPRPAPDPDRVHGAVTAELADGVRYVRAQPLLGLLVLTSFVMVMVGWPYLAFLPSVSNDLFDRGAGGYGLMSSVSAVAALGVTFWLARHAEAGQAWVIQSVAGIGMGLGLVLMGLAPAFPAELGALLVVGGAASAFQAMNNTLVLTQADLEHHGRVQSLLMLSFSGFGMAALPLGAVADAVGLRETLVGMGAICLVTMTVSTLWRGRHLRSVAALDALG